LNNSRNYFKPYIIYLFTVLKLIAAKSHSHDRGI
jgi:hypothetical protein